MTIESTGRWLNGTGAAIGLWVVAGAFVFELSTMQFWNDVLVGGGVLLLAGVAAYRGDDGTDGVATTASGLAAILGVWLLLSPVPFETRGLKLASDFFSGLAVASLDGWVAWKRAARENTVRTGGHPAERELG